MNKIPRNFYANKGERKGQTKFQINVAFCKSFSCDTPSEFLKQVSYRVLSHSAHLLEQGSCVLGNC